MTDWSKDASARAPAVSWTRPGFVVLFGLALAGAAVLAVVATSWWPVPADELAFYRGAERLFAGVPLYDPETAIDTPYAYWYPPPLAQVLAPVTTVVPAWLFSLGWVGGLVACVWWLAGRDVLRSLALVAFVPVALELATRNVHLLLAVLVVLALRRSSLFWIPATAIKIGPVVGIAYLAAARRYREAALVASVGAAVLAFSFLVSPDAWRQFAEIALLRGVASDGSPYLLVPFYVRLSIAMGLAMVAGAIGGRRGEVLVVVAVTLANPTLWANALALLAAVVPLLASTRGESSLASRVSGPYVQSDEPLRAN